MNITILYIIKWEITLTNEKRPLAHPYVDLARRLRRCMHWRCFALLQQSTNIVSPTLLERKSNQVVYNHLGKCSFTFPLFDFSKPHNTDYFVHRTQLDSFTDILRKLPP